LGCLLYRTGNDFSDGLTGLIAIDHGLICQFRLRRSEILMFAADANTFSAASEMGLRDQSPRRSRFHLFLQFPAWQSRPQSGSPRGLVCPARSAAPVLQARS